MIKRALLSVWDKTGLEGLAEVLHEHGVELISTGGTARQLAEWHLPVTPVEELTGYPPLMGGRVKTLHPDLMAAILCDRDDPAHLSDLESVNQSPIDLVVVNLYPFSTAAVEGHLPMAGAIEYIDIGGPSLLRAAAKNHAHVTGLCDPGQYVDFIAIFRENKGDIPQEDRWRWAADIFRHTADYDRMIWHYFSEQGHELPTRFDLHLTLKNTLRYGENPHQNAGFFMAERAHSPWRQIQGKALSYNNYLDVDSAAGVVSEFEEPAAVIIKHTNPCGFGLGKDLTSAYRLAVQTDPVSYFGGIVGVNQIVDEALAGALAESFLECIVAPGYDKAALALLKRKQNLRLLEREGGDPAVEWEIRSTAGGYLIQQPDRQRGEEGWEVVTERFPSEDELTAMRLGWKIVRFVKSNAVVFTNQLQLVGVGAGQMSRVDAVKLAVMKAQAAGLTLDGSSLASDAFFPFPDGLEVAADSGIRTVVQPGGSVRDREVVAAADRLGMAMIFTHSRHFKH